MTTNETLNEFGLKYLELKSELAELNNRIKHINDEMLDITNNLIDTVRDMGLNTAKTDQISIVLKTSNYPNVKNWEEVYTFILENEMPYLLQKRLSISGYEALKAEGMDVPGVETFEKTTIAVKKVTKK